MDGKAKSLALRPLPLRDVGHGRNHLSGQPSSTDDLVSRHLAGHQPEKRHQRPWFAARPGVGQLQDGVCHAA